MSEDNHQHNQPAPAQSGDIGPHANDAATWDARYAEQGQMWSGQPNFALVAEADELTPGRALDVGCGEGADAVWLATRGWQVTALDPSQVALTRARAAAEAAGVEISWWGGGLADVDLPLASFDLVTTFYPVLDLDTDPVDLLTRLVAPGGTLLVVHHAEFDRDRAISHGIDPDKLLTPDHVAEQLPDGWTLVSHERRARDVSGGAGAHHHDDLVVRAVRDR